MQESQSYSGQTSVGVTRGHGTSSENPFSDSGLPTSTDVYSISEGHTSVGAVRGHSSPPENPFSDSGHLLAAPTETVSEV